MRGAVCRMGRISLVTTVLDRGDPPDWMAGHVSQCLYCQALAAQARRVRRKLSTLPTERVASGSEGRAGTGTNLVWKLAGAALIALVVASRRTRGDRTRVTAPSFP